MWQFKRVSDIQLFLQLKTNQNLKIGFVPTMGALHEGHLSLIKKSNEECDITVCSVFVNPTQFNNKKDLDKYPRTIENDLIVLSAAFCDVLFLPEVKDIYPQASKKYYDLGNLEKVFEGEFRPGHFQGVCQVVDRLFEIVEPDAVYFGQKDYQQCMVINRLIQTTPGFENIEMNIVPTMREKSGLAMSSRNMRLSEEEKNKASAIHQTLIYLKEKLAPGDLSALLNTANQKLAAAGFNTEYISIADAETLETITNWNGHRSVVALVAAFMGEVRLIDNMVLTD